MKIFPFIAAFFSATAAVSADAAVYTTTKCKQFGQPEFQINVSDKTIPAEDIALMLSNLEELVANGERFKANQTMQFGWMITKFSEAPDKTLKILEPDFKAIPIEFVDSFNNTLKHLRSQKDALESVSKQLPLTFPSLAQGLVVHKNYKRSNQVLLERANPEQNDLAWWLSDLNDGEGNKDKNNFIKISLYQLALDRPDLVKFFAFPSELQVLVSKNKISVLKNGHELPLIKGSFLSELNKTSK